MTRTSVACLALPLAAACLAAWDILRVERRAQAWVEETHEGLEGEGL